MTRGAQNTVNVTGFDNGCGAHTILHAFEDNFDTIDWTRPGCQFLLDAFSEVYGVEATPENFRRALAAFPGYISKEYAFGPIVRKHIAEIIGLDDDYKETLSLQFLQVVRASLVNDTSEGTNQSLKRGNEAFLTRIRDQFRASRTDLDSFMEQHEAAILQYYNTNGFDNYINVLGDTAHGLMFTADEIHNYARLMKIDLEIQGRNDFYLENTVAEDERLFKLKLSNFGIHWRYQADYLTAQVIHQRNQETNVAPIDRDPILRQMSENGWRRHLQPFALRVQAACRNEALEADFIQPPSYHSIPLDPNAELLTWFKNEKFKRANDFLNRELDRGVDFDADEFDKRFDALSDSVAHGTLDEIKLLERVLIKPR